MSRAVRFDRYGGTDVLYLADVDPPSPGPGQVQVQVKAAGINPGETSIRAGLYADRWPATFPSGEGSDFAGVVSAVGDGVTGPAVGADVIGWTDQRASHAEHVAVPAEQVVPKPPQVPWEVAGGLYVAGGTAVGVVTASPPRGDTVVVSGAAGGSACSRPAGPAGGRRRDRHRLAANADWLTATASARSLRGRLPTGCTRAPRAASTPGSTCTATATSSWPSRSASRSSGSSRSSTSPRPSGPARGPCSGGHPGRGGAARLAELSRPARSTYRSARSRSTTSGRRTRNWRSGTPAARSCWCPDRAKGALPARGGRPSRTPC